MPQQIHLTEPHPSITARISNKFKGSSDTVRLPSARGGAGNIRTYRRSDLTSGLPEDTTFTHRSARDSDAVSQRSNSTSSSSSSASSIAHEDLSAAMAKAEREAQASGRKMFRGIGGAGNARSMSERRMFSFDEELEREEKLRTGREGSKVVMVGRGGAGNAAAVR